MFSRSRPINTFYRLDQEFVTEWDESIYAISAWEMLHSGEWIATTFHGDVDYYNAKPPLNIWLIALSFKVFGFNVFALQFTSAASAWLTVLLLWWWARRVTGETTALAAAAVLSTTFGFLHVHSGRTANPDAPFTLVILLTLVCWWAADRQRWHLAWLGPLFAAAFLLRGSAALMPLIVLIGATMLRRPRPMANRWRPVMASAILFAIPVGVWIFARWRFDRWAFFMRMLDFDFVERSTTALEGHTGPPWFYVSTLLKYQYRLAAVRCRGAHGVSAHHSATQSHQGLVAGRAHRTTDRLLGGGHMADPDHDGHQDHVVSQPLLSALRPWRRCFPCPGDARGVRRVLFSPAARRPDDPHRRYFPHR